MNMDTSVSNVILITVDSLRADAIGPYNNNQQTPVLDEIAATGTTFEHAFATGNWTPFSFPSLLASRPVFADTGEIGVTAVPTLAQTLTDAGIATGGFNAANGFLTEHWGYDAGFNTFDSFVASVGSNIYSRYLATHPTIEAWLQLAGAPFRRIQSAVTGGSHDRPFFDASRLFDVERAAQSFITETDAPFFLWIHYMDTHTPYVPAPRYIREVSNGLVGTHRMLLAHTQTGLGREVGERTLKDLRTLYHAAVRQVDASIGRIRETLKTANHADETALIIAGDHGEEFQEHGHLAHYPKLYDELIQTPLLIHLPDSLSVQQRRRVRNQVGLDDIPPTITSLFSVDSMSSWTGSSLLPTTVDNDSSPTDPVVSIAVRGETVTTQPIPRRIEDGELLVSVRDHTWTYIEHVDTEEIELYNRSADPTQQIDLSVDPTALQQRVIDQFAAVAAEHVVTLREAVTNTNETVRGSNNNGDTVGENSAVEARLSALGYK
ncbi:sulfatase [Haloquadratum walsbyi]|nr:sulfatase [Haloquadratum walsbyi]